MLRQERGPRHGEQQLPGLHALPGHHAVAGHRALPAHRHLSRTSGRSELACAPAASARTPAASPWDSAPTPPAGTSSGSRPRGPGPGRRPQAPPPGTSQRGREDPPRRTRGKREGTAAARGGKFALGGGGDEEGGRRPARASLGDPRGRTAGGEGARHPERGGPPAGPPRLTRRRFALVAIAEDARPRRSETPRERFRRPGKDLPAGGACVPAPAPRDARLLIPAEDEWGFAPGQITLLENMLVEPDCPQWGLGRVREGVSLYRLEPFGLYELRPFVEVPMKNKTQFSGSQRKGVPAHRL